MAVKFPYAGQSFTIKMDNGLEVKNAYHASENTITVEFLNGELRGTIMNVPFQWRSLADGYFMISWQESDKNTVVHCDNFEKKHFLCLLHNDEWRFLRDGRENYLI